jgi:hypothetical protein
MAMLFFVMSKDDNKVFVEWKAAMRSFPAITEKRSDDVGTGSARQAVANAFKIRTAAAGANGTF